MSITPTIDAELVPHLNLLPKFTFTAETLPAIRAGLDALFNKEVPLQGVKLEERKIPGPKDAPDVKVYTYTPDPAPTSPVPALIWIHQGGVIIGNAAMNHERLVPLARELGIVIVSPEYRLAPEVPYPAQIEDCYATLKWLNVNAANLHVDVNRIAVGGPSAGGGLSATLSLLARDRHEYKIAVQILLYPMLDDRTTLPATGLKIGEYIWTAENNKFAWTVLLAKTATPGSDNVPPYAAAARAKNLEGLPPAYIPVGELDLFREESIAYAQRLWAAGVSTELHVIPGAFHAFDLIGSAYISQALFQHVAHVLKRELIDKHKKA